MIPVTPGAAPGAESRVERLRFRRAPLAAAAVWFGVGICWWHWQQRFAAVSPLVVLAGALILLLLLAALGLRRGLRVAWVPVAGVWVVMGFAAGQWQPSPVYPVRLMGLADNLSRTVRGRVVGVRPAPVGGGGGG